MTREEFLQGITFLNIAYQKDMTQDQVAVWYSFFENDSIDVFQKAIKTVCATSRFFPSIAEIKAAMAESDLNRLSSDQAWNNVQYAISRYGYYQPEKAMESLTPEEQATVKSLGGFQKLCQQENNEWLRKDFCKIYDDMKGRDLVKYVTGDLISIADIQEKKKLLEGNSEYV